MPGRPRCRRRLGTCDDPAGRRRRSERSSVKHPPDRLAAGRPAPGQGAWGDQAFRRPRGGQCRGLRHPARLDRLADRTQWGRQDDVLQHDHRLLPADVRRDRLRRPSDHHYQRVEGSRQEASRSGRHGHRTDLPEHPPVRHDDRARQRPGGSERSPPESLVGRGAAHPEDAQRGSRQPGRGDAHPEPRRARGPGRRVGAEPALRRPASTRDRPRAGDPTEAPAAR